MKVFEFDEILTETESDYQSDCVKKHLITVDFTECREVMQSIGSNYDGEIDPEKINFCKVEAQQECLCGSICIPRLLDILGKRYKIQFFIDKQNVIIADDTDFTNRIINNIVWRKNSINNSREKFIYYYISEFMKRDMDLLLRYEKQLIVIDEEVSSGKADKLPSELVKIRKELLTLRSYYDELMDMCHDLEENINGFFTKKHLKHFGVLADRADRLMTRTSQLLEYSQQIKDSYQSYIDAGQNRNMQFLTIISTVFYPLTLVTGWYGMNFQNMPELENGYPGVILLSIIIVALIIILFKIKKIF